MGMHDNITKNRPPIPDNEPRPFGPRDLTDVTFVLWRVIRLKHDTCKYLGTVIIDSLTAAWSTCFQRDIR